MNTLTPAEIMETVEVLSAGERAAAHELAATIHTELTIAAQQPAAWVEVAAYLLASQIARGRKVASTPEPLIAKLKEYIGIRAEELLA